MITELEQYRRQFEAIDVEAHEILDGLTDAQVEWRPKPNAWSIAESLDHLIVTGRHSLFHIAEAVDTGRARGQISSEPFQYGLLERWLVWLMEPPPRIGFPAPRAYRPRPGRSGARVIAEFFQLQLDFRQALRSADGLDLAAIKVSNPVSRWIRFSLGQEFAFTLSHERRHLWQVRCTKRSQGIPTGEPHDLRKPWFTWRWFARE